MLVVLMVASSCTDDMSEYTSEECVVGKPVLAEMDFGDNSYEDIGFSTRSTQDGEYEHVVTNFYVLLFNSTTGEKVYGKYFDIKNKHRDVNGVNNATSEAWYVEPAVFGGRGENGYKTLKTPSHGKVKMVVPTGGPYNMYVFANIEAQYLQLSAAVFDGFRKESDLTNFTLRFTGNPMFRTGMIMMGKETVKINPNGSIVNSAKNTSFSYANNTAFSLGRLDAKIEVRIHIDPTKFDPNVNSELREFIPDTWEVVNVPRTCKLISGTETSVQPEGTSVSDYYFNTIPLNFESAEELMLPGSDKPVNNHIFSFYMFENKQNAKNMIAKSDTAFFARDLRIKDPKTGAYAATSGDMWVNANQWSTYLKISGKLEMKYKDANITTNKPQTLFADVVYYVHLGDFGKDINDYTIKRNTRYTYNISIVDVNKIIVEVETSQPGKNFWEPQSGATGDVVIAKEKVAVFDAHYGQTVFRFFPEYVEKGLSWFVDTPFSHESAPENVVLDNIDYKWVKFFRNIIKPGDTSNPNEHYSVLNRWYPGDAYQPASGKRGDRLMYVNELVEYLKEQADIYNNNKKKYPNDFNRWGEGTCFRKQNVQVLNNNGTEKTVQKWAVYFTAFVDEYYYEKCPVLGDRPLPLWTNFVNDCGDRSLHILCDNLVSKDGESSRTNSVSTIRQRPIQTPYTTDRTYLQDNSTGWGCETVDESGFDFATGEYGLLWENGSPSLNTNNDNLNGENGRYNTIHSFIGGTGYSWRNYFDISGDPSDPLTWELPESYDPSGNNASGCLPHNVHWLKNDKRNLRYSFLLRNRDNNGNGKIDDNEIKWYVASIKQLAELYIGGRGISGEAQLYPDKISRYTKADVYTGGIFKDCQKWRHHVISSTVKSNLPQLLWAEEGLSISDNLNEWEKVASRSIRCIRNLGVSDINALPEPLLKVDKTNRTIDASRVNMKSLRGGTELDPNLTSLGTTNENEQFALIPFGFEALPVSYGYNYDETGGYGEYPYDKLKYILDNGKTLSFPYPVDRNGNRLEGNWRLPNIRELAILSLYNLLDANNYYTPFTYYSHGYHGNKNDQNKNGIYTRSWYAKNGYISLQSGKETFNFVFVRDWNPR